MTRDLSWSFPIGLRYGWRLDSATAKFKNSLQRLWIILWQVAWNENIALLSFED